MSYPYTILVGNSPNLLANPKLQAVSWEAITRKLEKVYEERVTNGKSISLTGEYLLSCRMGHLQNLLREEKLKLQKNWTREQSGLVSALEAAWDDWYNALLHLECGCVHYLIAKWVLEKNAALITTNYDLTFEKALDMGNLPSFPRVGQKDISWALVEEEVAKNVSRHRGRVWHMHGDASCPASIVAGKSTYLEALSGLSATERREDSWLYQFLHSKVFICGLNFRQDEDLLMRALHLRTELPEEEQNPVFYFHFCRKGDEEGRRDVVIQLLKGLDVEFIEIPVYADQEGFDYRSAWYHLMGQIWENTASDSIATSPLLRSATPDDRSQQCISPVPERLHAGRRCCAVRTSTPTMLNPDRCWINIGMEKLRANWGKDWFFECRIGGNLYVYHYPARELEQIFKQKNVARIETGTPRYNLYIDYRRGELYSSVTPFNKTPLVVLKRDVSPSQCSPLG